MKQFKLSVIFAMLLIAVSSFAQASDEKATAEDVQTLLKLTQVDTQIQSELNRVVVSTLPEMLRNNMRKRLPEATPEQLKQIGEFAAKTTEDHFKALPMAEIVQALVPFYQSHYTHAEALALIQFLSLPVGQKFLANESQFSADTDKLLSPVMGKWVDRQVDEVRKATEDFAKQMKEQSGAKPAAQPGA